MLDTLESVLLWVPSEAWFVGLGALTTFAGSYVRDRRKERKSTNRLETALLKEIELAPIYILNQRMYHIQRKKPDDKYLGEEGEISGKERRWRADILISMKVCLRYLPKDDVYRANLDKIGTLEDEGQIRHMIDYHHMLELVEEALIHLHDNCEDENVEIWKIQSELRSLRDDIEILEDQHEMALDSLGYEVEEVKEEDSEEEDSEDEKSEELKSELNDFLSAEWR